MLPMRNRVLSPLLLLPACFSMALLPAFRPPVHATVVGINVVAPSLTVERIQQLAPKQDRAAWLAYLKRSEEQMKVDRATLAAELKPGETPPPQPEEGLFV